MNLQQLANQLGATLVGGNGEVEIRGIATLNEAKADQLSFLTNPAYAQAAASTSAAAVLAPTGQVELASLQGGASLLEHDAPYLAHPLIIHRQKSIEHHLPKFYPQLHHTYELFL